MQKSNRFSFFEDEKKTQNFARTNFQHFDIYIDEKHILTYNLSFKKYYVGLDSKPDSKLKNNTFQFYKNKAHIENFVRINFKFFYIYKDQKYILILYHFFLYFFYLSQSHMPYVSTYIHPIME